MEVILVVGLPGSGKTTLAQSLLKEGDILIDDPKQWSEIESAVLSNRAGKVVITDPLLCFKTSQERAEARLLHLGATVTWIFFANDPEQCQKNALLRKDKKVKNDIKYFSSKYHIPSGVDIRAVFK